MAKMGISVIKKGVFTEDFELHIKHQFLSIRDGTILLANASRDHMQNTIKMNKHRGAGTGHLERSIYTVTEPLGDGQFRVGVGEIGYLDAIAPYWYILNYGGMVSPKARRVAGFFGGGDAPDSAFGLGQGTDPFTWQPEKTGMFMMTVKTPIAPVFYIEKVISWLRTVTRIHFANWTKKTKIVTKQVVFGSTL